MGKNFLSHSWPFLFSGIISTIHMKVDQIILQKMIGAVAVGYYAVAEGNQWICYLCTDRHFIILFTDYS